MVRELSIQKANRIAQEYALINELTYKITKLESERDLNKFMQNTWDIIEPGVKFLKNWHINLISEYLMALSLGKIKHLIVNIPPRNMKSTLISVDFPCWEWINSPHRKYVFASYGMNLTKAHARKRKMIITSDFYQGYWSDKCKISPKLDTQIEWANASHGVMFATSVGSALVGRGGSRIIIDDPVDPMRVDSPTLRESANRWYSEVVVSRLDDKSTDSIIVVMQRLHQNDLVGYITGLESSDLNESLIIKGDWTILRLPAIAEEDEDLKGPISDRTYHRNKGEALWENREPLPVLHQIAEDVREYAFAGQYQQRPSDRKGNVFMRAWFDVVKYDELPRETTGWLLSVDAAFKKASDSSFVVIGVWCRSGLDNYLVDQLRDRYSFLETIGQIRMISRKYPRIRHRIIEAAANGEAILNSLQDEFPDLVAAKPNDSKEGRAIGITSIAANGHIRIPRVAPWLTEFESEVYNFPAASTNDQVDAMSQAITYLEDTYNPSRRKKGEKRKTRLVFNPYK